MTQSEKELSVNLGYGSSISADKETQPLTVMFRNIKLVGDIEHSQTFTNTDGITSSGEVSDKTSSMQDMRNAYNSHTHTCPDGTTSTPNSSM